MSIEYAKSILEMLNEFSEGNDEKAISFLAEHFGMDKIKIKNILSEKETLTTNEAENIIFIHTYR